MQHYPFTTSADTCMPIAVAVDRSDSIDFSATETVLITQAPVATQIQPANPTDHIGQITFGDTVAHSELSIPKNRPGSHRIIVHHLCQRLHAPRCCEF
jgi:hypothetical protein